MNGIIFDIKEFAVHDGPGLRTTVFLKGCPMSCVWCHNPEGLSGEPQLMVREKACHHCGLCRLGCSHPDCRPFGRCLHICPQGLLRVSGEVLSAQALAGRIQEHGALLAQNGGVTFSGGEPLLQAAFLQEVLDLTAKIPAALETAGYAPPEVFAPLIRRMQMVYFDLKLADEQAHRHFTGVSNRPILQNLEVLRQSGVPCTVRTPLIPGITDSEENLRAIRGLVGDLPWETLPYNDLAGAKYAMLQMRFPYEGKKEREGESVSGQK